MKTIKLFLTAMVFIITNNLSVANEMSVVEVKRNITLSDDDTIYKDFYINAGEGSALRKNMVVKVKRKMTVKESPTKNIGDFEALVGQLKIIQVGNKVSVAREFKLTPRDEEPMLEQIGIMAGDHIDLNGSYIDYSKPRSKNKTSEAEPKKDEAITTAAVVSEKEETTKIETRTPASTEPTLFQKIIPLPGM